MRAVCWRDLEKAENADVLVVADAGPGAGLGHIARCSAVATALRVRGLSCRCLAVGATHEPLSSICWEPLHAVEDVPDCEPPLLLLDSYNLESQAIRARARSRLLAVMHDIGPLPHDADLTVTTHPQLLGAGPWVVGGPSLTCLGARFWGLPDPREVPKRVERILVTTGAGDPGGHAVGVAVAVKRALAQTEVVLVRGPHASFEDPDGVLVLDRPDSLLEPLINADLTVSSAGSSLLEALAVGTPTVGLVMADNQRPKAQSLAEQGATELFAPDVPHSIAAAVSDLANDQRAREQRVRRGRELVDGHGALRVAYLLWRLLITRGT
jgi:UDP-2,4-diacetamido-2,4,6-trideoxy-beta-L-altropyranose hydrolase